MSKNPSLIFGNRPEPGRQLHYRISCPDCFDTIEECECGGPERFTKWRLCDICMNKKPDLLHRFEEIPAGTLLDAKLVFQKIMPIMDFPKEFIPMRLYPGYDQWRDKVLAAIISSAAMPQNKGTAHEHTRDEVADGSGVGRDEGEKKSQGEGE